MKRLAALTMTLVMAVSLAACGGKAQSVTYTMEQDNEGLKMTDTMTLNAKGDKVQKMEETIALDMTGFDDDTQTLMTCIPLLSPLIPQAMRYLSSLSRDCFR